MRLFFKGRSEKELKKFDFSIRVRVLKKIKFYINQQNPLDFAKPLKDYKFGSWRFEIGNYRAIFDIEDDKIIILKIGHRKDIYK